MSSAPASTTFVRVVAAPAAVRDGDEEGDDSDDDEPQPARATVWGGGSPPRGGRKRALHDPVDDMEHLGRWESPEGRLTADTEQYATGTQSARLSASTSDERASMYRSFPDGIDLSDRVPSMALKLRPNAPPTGIYFQLFAPDDRNRIDMWHAIGLDGWHRLDFGPTKVVGNPNLTDVRKVGVVVWTGDRSRSIAVDAIRTTPRADRGYVVLTFDDGLASQYEEAYAIMREFDFPGVAAVMPKAVGWEGRMSLDRIAELHDAGWDVVNHPQEAKALPAYPPAKQERLMRENKQWLLDHGFERGAPFAVWPYGGAGPHTREIGGRYYHLAFADGTCPSGVPFTAPMTVSRVNGDDVEKTKRMIAFAAEFDQVAVPMYHPVGPDPDHVSPDAFRDVMAFIDRQDVEVVTASTLWNDVVR
ncbi:MAG: polysaccharide deacetylase family protein [Halorientalis sp.]